MVAQRGFDEHSALVTDRVRALLAEFEDLTSDDVSKRLADANAYGLRGVSEVCPLAQYVSSRLDTASISARELDVKYKVHCFFTRVRVQVLTRYSNPAGQLIATASVGLPDSVQKFIREFDAGAHSELRYTDSVNDL